VGQFVAFQGLVSLFAALPSINNAVPTPDGREDTPSIHTTRAGKPWVASALQQVLATPTLLVCPRPEMAREIFGQITSVLGEDTTDVLLYPEREPIPYERLQAESSTIHQRLIVLQKLQEAAASESSLLVVTSVAALAQKTLDPSAYREMTIHLRPGETIPQQTLLNSLLEMQYEREPVANRPGTFSARGGIVDIHVTGSLVGTRLDFLGDTVESIREYDPISQKSFHEVRSCTLIPASEALPTCTAIDELSASIETIDISGCSDSVKERIEEEFGLLAHAPASLHISSLYFHLGLFCRSTILDYLPESSIVITNEISQITEAAIALEEAANNLRDIKIARGDLPKGFPSSLDSASTILARLKQCPQVEITDRASNLDSSSMLHIKEPPSFRGDIVALVTLLQTTNEASSWTVLVTQHSKRVSDLLLDAGLPVHISETIQTLTPDLQGQIIVVQGHLNQGVSVPTPNGLLTILTDTEIFGVTKIRRTTRTKTASSLEPEIATFENGSYVVHIDHGVGKVAGTTWDNDTNGQPQEYLVLSYAEDDRLYVPMNHLHRVSKYVFSSDKSPHLTRLGSAEWARTKQRVTEATQELAEEIIRLHAERQQITGVSYPADSPWEQELSDSFEFEETPDQEDAIESVKLDMMSDKVMDRLICGDVGYGKTEVAVRAAFKAVTNGKQVAILVPTTVLAQQHYQTLADRLSPYPITVDVISRLRSKPEQKAITEALGRGEIDICIGTHRLLQRDIEFANLGLVIVDEEQRFGVAQKERVKKLSDKVDVLTLSATPIPRTLQMALSGLKDMSIIGTSPQSRLAVQTYLTEESNDTVREAILREIDRGGQVFFIHNRVRNIAEIAHSLSELVPEASIGIAHGQMPEGQLASVMQDFYQETFNVLVCTTIIESGLDLPNVNTLIINRSHMFGLTQLHQLRGRVGRGTQRAYCYLLVPRGQELTETAGKRLDTILGNTALGSGFQIAMSDLEIRGAGEVLGAQQSGYMQAVGFDLYKQMLNDALKTQTPAPLNDTTEIPSQDLPDELPRIDLPLEAHIPSSYVDHLETRMALYRRLASFTATNDLSELREELQDRFGPMPRPFENLLFLVEIRIIASHSNIISVRKDGDHATLRLKMSLDGARPLLQKSLGNIGNVGHNQISVPWHREEEIWKNRLVSTLEILIEFKERTDKLLDAMAVQAD
jgi:transcription-repair coupling factor (superfamily II helicase)